MSFIKKIENLDLYLLNTRDPAREEVPLVEKTFQLWKVAWEDEFKALGVKVDKLYSNDFLERQALTLFSNLEPVAMILMHHFWLRPSQLEHAYFRNYPESVIKNFLHMEITKCQVLSYLTCKLDWRKKHTNVPISEVLFSLGIKAFERSDSEYLISSVRKIGVTDIFLRHGAVSLHEGKMFNMDVDYMYVTKKEARMSSLPQVSEIANQLWAKMEARALARQLKRVA